jgi:hypothetical protein
VATKASIRCLSEIIDRWLVCFATSLPFNNPLMVLYVLLSTLSKAHSLLCCMYNIFLLFYSRRASPCLWKQNTAQQSSSFRNSVSNIYQIAPFIYHTPPFSLVVILCHISQGVTALHYFFIMFSLSQSQCTFSLLLLEDPSEPNFTFVAHFRVSEMDCNCN